MNVSRTSNRNPGARRTGRRNRRQTQVQRLSQSLNSLRLNMKTESMLVPCPTDPPPYDSAPIYQRRNRIYLSLGATPVTVNLKQLLVNSPIQGIANIQFEMFRFWLSMSSVNVVNSVQIAVHENPTDDTAIKIYSDVGVTGQSDAAIAIRFSRFVREYWFDPTSNPTLATITLKAVGTVTVSVPLVIESVLRFQIPDGN